jgi:hypothetical protein
MPYSGISCGFGTGKDGGIMANRDIKKDVKKKKKTDAAPAAGAKILKTVVAQPEVITKKKGDK